MKRFFSLIIICFLTVNVCACSQKEASTEESVSISISDYDTNSETRTSNEYDENSTYPQEDGAISSTVPDWEHSTEVAADKDNNENNVEQQMMALDSYRAASKYWNEVVEWDEDNGRYGMDRPLEFILSSDQREYTIEDLKDYPEDIIYLALNEIYARHGYIFKNEDLQNYFMGQVWYTPLVDGEGFNDEVFNDYEKENLKLLLKILNR